MEDAVPIPAEVDEETAAQTAISQFPEAQRNCLSAVFSIQKETTKLGREFQQQLREIELRYQAMFTPLNTERKFTLERFAQLTGFWLKVLQNDPDTCSYVFEKDALILIHLTDIRCVHDAQGDDFTLVFEFAENEYIADSQLTKRMVHDADGELIRGEGCAIHWRQQDFTEKSVKKKQTKKGKTVKSKVTVSSNSFFSFFKTSKRLQDLDSSYDSDSADPCVLQLLEDDDDLSLEIKDEIIPYALLYYLNVRTAEDSSSESESEEEEEPKGVKWVQAPSSGCGGGR